MSNVFQYAVVHYHVKTCIWLLDNGVDADRENIWLK